VEDVYKVVTHSFTLVNVVVYQHREVTLKPLYFGRAFG